MGTSENNIAVARMLRVAAIMWLASLGVMAIINLRASFLPETIQVPLTEFHHSLLEPLSDELAQSVNARLQGATFQYVYYPANALTALALLGLTVWPKGRDWLGRAYVPLNIIVMSVSPVLTKYIGGATLLGPFVAAGGMVVILMALVLTAWQYRWRHVVMFCLGTAALDVATAGLVGPVSLLTFFAGLFTLVQTVGFLVVGYFISAVMEQLRVQQDSLQSANVQLRHHVSTLEHLTISRERNRMARELHDTLAHTLSALSVQLETVKAYWSVDPAAAQAGLDKSLEATRSGLHETRRALKALRASPLDDLGLRLALRRLAESAASRAELDLDLVLPEQHLTLAPDAEQCIYRVAQEAVTNVTHHANARRLSLRLTRDDNTISLLVQDDGQGFDLSRRVAMDHFGLPGMRERAEMAGGRLTINSDSGSGTTVLLTLASEG